MRSWIYIPWGFWLLPLFVFLNIFLAVCLIFLHFCYFPGLLYEMLRSTKTGSSKSTWKVCLRLLPSPWAGWRWPQVMLLALNLPWYLFLFFAPLGTNHGQTHCQDHVLRLQNGWYHGRRSFMWEFLSLLRFFFFFFARILVSISCLFYLVIT